ncbi:unnamed protein product [Protopolystoma xenopodis]|uniref:Uncharacterized protein n=1 Tax=Protopolystoma xenopodis TaxID=117903 RepID=A0A3S5AFL1_9PLAT|nr:unnamed protein product [Protopolystoma xenopodis]
MERSLSKGFSNQSLITGRSACCGREMIYQLYQLGCNHAPSVAQITILFGEDMLTCGQAAPVRLNFRLIYLHTTTTLLRHNAFRPTPCLARIRLKRN